MDVTGTMAMARALGRHGALTALHKHYPEGALAEFFAGDDGAHAFYSLGVTTGDLEKLAAVAKRAPLRFLCIDVANGYSERFLDTVKRVRDEHPKSVIMAGNVVTGDMTEALILAGADIVKIGIGPGSVCTTRRVTGVGYPQLSAIIECADAAHGLKGQVCADGGCTVPGDIAKAYGAGADFVMLGGMLAGHDECEGEIRYEERDGERVPVAMGFYGMSSETAMKKYAGGVAKYRAAEGKAVETPYRGPVEQHDGRDHGRRALMHDLYRRDAAQGGAQAHHVRARDGADQRRVRPVVIPLSRVIRSRRFSAPAFPFGRRHVRDPPRNRFHGRRRSARRPLLGRADAAQPRTFPHRPGELRVARADDPGVRRAQESRRSGQCRIGRASPPTSAPPSRRPRRR